MRFELYGYKNTVVTLYVALRDNASEAFDFAKYLMQAHDLDRIEVRDADGQLIYEL